MARRRRPCGEGVVVVVVVVVVIIVVVVVRASGRPDVQTLKKLSVDMSPALLDFNLSKV